ncbi:unnamed protein product [Calypogeia fissa]
MSGSKRSCPFGFTEGGGGSPGHAKALKEDTGSIYAETLNKLKLGARAATTGRGSQVDLCSSLERLAIYSLPATTPQLAASSPPCHVLSATSGASASIVTQKHRRGPEIDHKTILVPNDEARSTELSCDS